MIPFNTKVKVTKISWMHEAHPGDEGYVIAVLKHNTAPDEYGINFTSGYISQGYGYNLDGRLKENTGNWIPETDLEVIC